jgi:hypothetical protein
LDCESNFNFEVSASLANTLILNLIIMIFLIVIGIIIIYIIGFGIAKAMFETLGNNKEDSGWLAVFWFILLLAMPFIKIPDLKWIRRIGKFLANFLNKYLED